MLGHSIRAYAGMLVSSAVAESSVIDVDLAYADTAKQAMGAVRQGHDEESGCLSLLAS